MMPSIRLRVDWATVVEVVGLVALATGAGLAWPPAGLLVAGAGMIFLAQGMGRR